MAAFSINSGRVTTGDLPETSIWDIPTRDSGDRQRVGVDRSTFHRPRSQNISAPVYDAFSVNCRLKTGRSVRSLTMYGSKSRAPLAVGQSNHHEKFSETDNLSESD